MLCPLPSSPTRVSEVSPIPPPQDQPDVCLPPTNFKLRNGSSKKVVPNAYSSSKSDTFPVGVVLVGTNFAPFLLGGFFSPLPTFPEGVVRPIVLNGVQCSGTESELSECDRAEFISSCSRTMDVGIHCGECIMPN